MSVSHSELSTSTYDTTDYHTGYESTVKWENVQERIDILNFAMDPAARAEDIARNFSKGDDIKALSFALHQVLVPDYATRETDFPMKVSNPSTGESHELAKPDERDQIFQHAGVLIEQLSAMRDGTPEDSKAFLERTAVVMALSIVLAHQFAEGNGRTARTIGELIYDGPSSEDLKIAAGNRPDKGFRMNSYTPDKSLSAIQALDYAASVGINLSNRKSYVEQASEHMATPFWNQSYKANHDN